MPSPGRPPLNDIAPGQRFGNAIVVEPGELRGRNRTWRLRCDCGVLFERESYDLRSYAKRGLVLSCRDCSRARQGNRQTPASKRPAVFRAKPRNPLQCTLCAGNPHRRRKPYCFECRLPFRELPEVRAEVTYRVDRRVLP